MGDLNTKDFFDHASTEWDKKVHHNEDKIKQYLEYIDFAAKDSVLDVGTGTGIMLKFILPKLSESTKITAVDIAPKMLEIARQKYQDPRVKFRLLDIEKEQHRLENYDLIMLYSVFPHLQEKSKAIEAFSKCLTKNGELCIMHSNSRGEINEMHKSLGEPVCYHQLPPVEILKELGKKYNLEIRAALDEDEGYFFLARHTND